MGKNQNDVNSSSISPIKTLLSNEIEANKAEFDEIGIQAIKNRQVAALLLAGGMGTRLGSDDQKGMYDVVITHSLYIFECLFKNLLEVVKRAGVFIPFFIMTSEKNDQKTKEFLKSKNYFGYDEKYIRFFVQEMAPCVDFDGKILLEEKNRMAKQHRNQ